MSGEKEGQPGTMAERKRPAPRGTAFYPRKRANAACQVCRARKTNCDNRKPSCSYCVSVGATCNQTAEDLSSFDPASLKILERIDVLEKLLRQQQQQQSPSPQPLQEAEHSPQQQENLNLPSRPRDSLSDGPTRISPTVSESSHHGLFQLARTAITSPLKVLPGQPDQLLRMPVFRNRLPDHGLTGSIESTSLPAENRPASGPPDTTFIGGGLLDNDIRTSNGVNELLDRFFEFVHCKNPILKEAPTRRLVLSTALEGFDSSARSCLSLLVCALGHLATHFGNAPEVQEADTALNSPAYAKAEALFQAAQCRMGTVLLHTGDDHLIAPQCLLLSGFYMMCVFRPFLAWRSFSQALASCQQFRFLRRMYDNEEGKITNSTNDIELENEQDSQEQAVYWSAWKSERELRQCLCLPDFPATGDTSHLYPPLFPNPPMPANDGLIDGRRERASWLFYLAEISLRRIMSTVCSEISSLYQNRKSDAAFLARLATLVLEYEEQGRRWAASLPAELSLETPAESDDVCRFVLRGHYIQYREVIYWPFLASRLSCYSPNPLLHSPHTTTPQTALPPGQRRTSPVGTSSTVFPETQDGEASHYTPSSPGTDSSLSLTVMHFAETSLKIQIQRIQVNYPGFRHRHHGTFFMISCCMRSAIILLAAVLTGLKMPPGWREAVDCTAGLLATWETEVPRFLSWRTFLTSTLSDIPEPL